MVTTKEIASGLTQADLLRLFDYDQESGRLYWKETVSNNIKAGMEAGPNLTRGYHRIGYKGMVYLSHRLIWMLMTGDWPVDLIDHINCDSSDNSWKNLRAATHAENMHNSKPRRVGFLKGAFRHNPQSRWYSMIRIDGRLVNLGSFDAEQEAHDAYVKAAKAEYGTFARAA